MDILRALDLEPSNSGAFSGSDWQAPKQGPVLQSLNPSTGKPIASVHRVDEAAYEPILQRAEQAFLLWRKVPAPKRGELIRLIAERLREKKALLGELVSLEMGKSLQEGLGEVQEMIDIADFAVGQSRMLYGSTMHSERPEHRMYEQWHPLGITLIISAFNFPVAVWAWNAFLAAVCGNVCIWKPSSTVPLSAIAVQKIVNQLLIEQQAPPIFSLIIPENHQLAERLLDDPRIALVSFTGSTPVGKQVAARVAARLGRSILELGGNNAIILDETADLELALPAILFGAIGTAGQRCTSTRRLLVQSALMPLVKERLTKAFAKLRVADPLDPKSHMGPLVDQRAVQQFQKAIARIKSLGGQILFGGQVLQRPGYFVEPTLVEGLDPSADILQAETFAPILYLIPYEDFEQAIALQNAVPQGLSSALFTSRIQHSERFLSAEGSDCGIANINIGTSGAEIGAAFGGEKETGGGREAGSDAWKGYMRRQSNTINWGKTLPLAQNIIFNLDD